MLKANKKCRTIFDLSHYIVVQMEFECSIPTFRANFIEIDLHWTQISWMLADRKTFSVSDVRLINVVFKWTNTVNGIIFWSMFRYSLFTIWNTFYIRLHFLVRYSLSQLRLLLFQQMNFKIVLWGLFGKYENDTKVTKPKPKSRPVDGATIIVNINLCHCEISGNL